MTLTGLSRIDRIAGVALDRRAHLIRVHGDASLVGREVRSHAARAVESGRLVAIVDLTDATRIGGPLAWELSRAHERLLWRGGHVVVVSDCPELQPLFDSFGQHRTPDVVATLAEALSAAQVSEAGVARACESPDARDGEPPATGRPPAAVPFSWRRVADVPPTWTFEILGGGTAPGVARAAIARVLMGRMDPRAQADAMLLVSEAVTNSVMHGGADEDGTVTLTVTISRGALRVVVADPVGGFEPPPRPVDPLQASGRGLPLIHSLALDWGVEDAPDGQVWFELPRAAA